MCLRLSGNDQNPDLFAQSLAYGSPNTTMPGNATPQYNGNISQTMWQVAGKEVQGYAFQYDDLNRMTEATYSDYHSWNVTGSELWQSNPFSTENKYRESVAYDVRGNITGLVRHGLKAEGLTQNGIFT